MERFIRTQALLGEDAMTKLKNARVALFGVGGVGGYVLEALVRSGVGAVDVVDGDTVNLSNLNRQIIALESTVGMPKTTAAKERMLQINPDVKICEHNYFYGEEAKDKIDFSVFDYVVDAIDDVRAKTLIAVKCKESDVPLISSMGFGNKLDPLRIEVSDIKKTSVCPLARTMRKRLKDAGVDNVKVVYSKEEPKVGLNPDGTRVLASIAFVPSAAGLVIASEVIKNIIR